ncbi:hypothetical protein [Arthrobacter cryoconiti]|uniref:Uncharacterized protein n=1 Tax=Arthrobacter cryoconiti TaxID=748907 RepID=A0ABV8QZD8_9MICC|nr:hypothetical protein [Arthrobacter cryoconiti]MCC9069297.1 hypothetical protein [Arthrobacter cryoconiti]
MSFLNNSYKDHLPKMPKARGSWRNGPESPTAPFLVRLAAKLLWVGALMQVLGTVMASIYATSPQRKAALLDQLALQGTTGSNIDSLQTSGLVVVIVGGLVTVTFYWLLGHFVSQGRSWARMLGAVLMVLTISQLTGLQFPTGLVVLAQFVFGVLAIVLCYLPVSQQHFAAVKASRSN